MYDDVTGLASRFLFFDRLGLALARTERRQSSAAVLLVDLDGFEQVGQKAGAGTSEEALREVADRLMTVIRPGDSAARVGEGQFAVLCEEIEGEDDATSIAQRLAAGLAFPFDLEEAQVHLSASVGVALAGGRNARIVVIDSEKGDFLHAIGEGDFTGATPNSKVAGPNGVLLIESRGELWSGDGDSTTKVHDAESGRLLQSISTHGTQRCDELATDGV